MAVERCSCCSCCRSRRTLSVAQCSCCCCRSRHSFCCETTWLPWQLPNPGLRGRAGIQRPLSATATEAAAALGVALATTAALGVAAAAAWGHALYESKAAAATAAWCIDQGPRCGSSSSSVGPRRGCRLIDTPHLVTGAGGSQGPAEPEEVRCCREGAVLVRA